MSKLGLFFLSDGLIHLVCRIVFEHVFWEFRQIHFHTRILRFSSNSVKSSYILGHEVLNSIYNNRIIPKIENTIETSWKHKNHISSNFRKSRHFVWYRESFQTNELHHLHDRNWKKKCLVMGWKCFKMIECVKNV